MASITVEVDSAAWNDSVDNWRNLAYVEGVAANLDAAQDIGRRTKALLWQFHHAPDTRTPSPPGEPPAMISGRLSASVQATHDGDDALVGPTSYASSENGPYGRFLELGGVHVAHSGKPETVWLLKDFFGKYQLYHAPDPQPQMWWKSDGYWYHSPILSKVARPYLAPATEDAVHSGATLDIYWRHWLTAQQMAAG